MVSCSVLNCGVTYDNNPNKHSFHRFPVNPVIREKWVRVINRIGWEPREKSVVCSKHFEENCFMQRKHRRILKKNSVPTEDVPVNIKLRRHVSSYVYRDISPKPSTSQPKPLTPRKKKLISKCSKLKQKIKEKQQKIRNLTAKTKRLKKKLNRAEELIEDLKKRPGLQDNLNEIIGAGSIETLQLLIDRANKKKSGDLAHSSTYNEQLKKFALTLHFYSPRCYNYIREKFDLCLPHVNTLRQWYQRVDCEPGFTAESFNTIKNIAKEKDLLVNVTFDEMSVKEYTEFVGNQHYGTVNFGNDNDAGDESTIANQVLVFMVVAINSFWKIPVGFFPGRSFTASQKANLLKICLGLLIETACTVISITFDGIASNLNMCNILGAKLDKVPYKTYFTFKDKKYYIILDPCHLLKLIRNIFCDKKVLVDGSGKIIDYGYIIQLFDLQMREGLTLANKLTFRHIHYLKQKMKVKLAAQLLSRSVAIGIEFCRSSLHLPEFLYSQATELFILNVNDVFDIFNSKNFLSHGLKKPLYAGNKENIFQKIGRIYEYFLNLKFQDGTLVVTSTRRLGLAGFLMNILSLKCLYVDYIETERLRFLPFYKLSQDHLETFFSAIRSRGGFDNNPTVRNFISAYKRLLCHTEVRICDTGNCLELENITILSSVPPSTEERINCSVKFNNINKQYEIENKTNLLQQNEDDMSSHFNRLPDSFNDLTLFIKSIVEYIAGFVVKKIKKSIHCEDCIQSLEHVRNNESLISLKDFDTHGKGFMCYPSTDVIKVCEKCECYFRENIKSKINFDTKKSFEKAVLFILRNIINENVFPSLIVHSYDQEALNNHRYLVVKYIIEIYLSIRLRYEAKLKKLSKETLRNYLNKIILFRGQ